MTIRFSRITQWYVPVPKGLLLSRLIHRVSKNCAELFLSELSQISTNFDNYWQKGGKEAEIM